MTITVQVTSFLILLESLVFIDFHINLFVISFIFCYIEATIKEKAIFHSNLVTNF